VGKVNGWVHGDAILGRVTEMTEPEPPPSVPDMLEQLASAYHECIEHRGAAQDDAEMLLSIAGDMRWYAARVGPERWDTLPRPNKWSFAQHLWHILKQVKGMANSGWPEPMMHLINHGKEHVGQVAEVFGLLEPSGGES
jgi:hypothetical protein